MEDNYISILITKFFENNLPKEIQYKFHKWFIESKSHYEKKEVMLKIWENQTIKTDETTTYELKKIKKRINEFEKNKRFTIYRRMCKAAVILLLPLLSGVSVYFLKKEKIIIIEPEIVECFVPYGERKKILLSDGSEVWLNAGSLLLYSKEFTGKTRTLYLNGEANFNVTKDTEKPFIVNTEYIDIEVLGTVFNVQAYSGAETSMATLEEGSVKIRTKDENKESIILTPNEQIIYNRITKTYVKETVDAVKKGQWKDGFLLFKSSSFDEIIKTLERRFGISVNYDKNKFTGRTFNIKFSPEEDIQQVFDILKDIGQFKYKIKGNIVYID